MTSIDFANFMPKTKTEQLIEARFGGRDIKAILDDLYTMQGMSQAAVGEALGVNRVVVVDMMKRWGIATRDRRALAQS